MRIALTALGGLVLAACQGGTPASNDQDLGNTPADTLTLRAGETMTFSGIEIGFTQVTEDSRCPVDVLCPWAGNGGVDVAVGPPSGQRGPTYQLVLNTSLEPHEGEAWGLRVRLLDLRPHPVSTQTIPPGDYVIDLEVGGVSASPR